MSKKEVSIADFLDSEQIVDIISNIPSNIFFKDTDLKYRFLTHHWAQLLSDDILGKTDVEIRKDTENAIEAMAADRKIIDSKKGTNYVIECNIDDYQSFLELIKEPIFDSNGEVIGIVGLINDVTENMILKNKIVGMSGDLERQCNELEASNEELKLSLDKVEKMHAAQKLFTASMNHELRSPLNGIIGNLQLLMDDDDITEKQLEYVKNAFFSSQHMLEIVNELLDFAKLEMSRISLKNEKFSLLELLNNIQFLAEVQTKAKGLAFEVIKDKSVQDYYVGDKTRVSQIIYNLVSNAIKYTEKGCITLSVSYIDCNLIISCADTGQGISDENIDRLFDPYVRINEANNSHITGTGLGLSVVKKIIEVMNGEITVSSKVNEGSNFTVKLPLGVALNDENSLPVEESDVDDTPFEFNKICCLCVDDSKVNVNVMVSILNQMGIQAEDASCGKEGIEKANAKKYDVIFMDHMMPEMDGIETIQYIRKNCKINAKTPFIMLTGNTDDSYGELYRNNGINEWLFKPVVKEQIKDKIISALKK